MYIHAILKIGFPYTTIREGLYIDKSVYIIEDILCYNASPPILGGVGVVNEIEHIKISMGSTKWHF
jgi:hypothetical protein